MTGKFVVVVGQFLAMIVIPIGVVFPLFLQDPILGVFFRIFSISQVDSRAFFDCQKFLLNPVHPSWSSIFSVVSASNLGHSPFKTRMQSSTAPNSIRYLEPFAEAAMCAVRITLSSSRNGPS